MNPGYRRLVIWFSDLTNGLKLLEFFSIAAKYYKKERKTQVMVYNIKLINM
jgi:hypothetical protein